MSDAAGAQPRMIISPLWLQGALLTFVLGFAVMTFLAINLYQDEPPIPGRVVDPFGRTVFTREDVLKGQGVFQKYGLMEYGSVLGHGAYLGPDLTAEYLHMQAEEMARGRSGAQAAPVPSQQVASELHENRYDPRANTLAFTGGQARSFEAMKGFYSTRFNSPQSQDIVPARYIQGPEELHQLTSFISWTAWTATANRPGYSYS